LIGCYFPDGLGLNAVKAPGRAVERGNQTNM
jgi:hypothetical protein